MAKPLPSAVRVRLAKLLPLLSSDRPGEAANAAAMINRTLKAAGLDIHALKDVVTGEPELAVPVPTAEPESAPAFHLYERPDGRFEIPEPELSPLLSAIREQVYYTPWEDEFIAGFEDRCAKWPGGLVRLSEKQIAIFTRLIGRISP